MRHMLLPGKIIFKDRKLVESSLNPEDIYVIWSGPVNNNYVFFGGGGNLGPGNLNKNYPEIKKVGYQGRRGPKSFFPIYVSAFGISNKLKQK